MIPSNTRNTPISCGIIAKFGGKVLRAAALPDWKGRQVSPLRCHRTTFEQGVACFTSPEYDAAAAFRRTGAGEVETIMVDAGDATQ
jgi:uncharacterized protein (DUF1330 family)